MTDLLKVTIKRVASRTDGTFGVLLVGSLPIAVTAERPWLDNKKGESCIPAGTYIAKRVLSPKFGDTFEITGVTGRAEILLHKGNIMEDSHGCVLVGEYFNIWVTGQCSIASSSAAFLEFMQTLKGVDSFKIEVINCY